jgi:hypothetical protein
MSEEEKIIDSTVAAMLLNINTNNLRQLVYRKMLVPVGRQKRRSEFRLADVLALQTRRNRDIVVGEATVQG